MNEEIYNIQLDYILKQYEYLFLETSMRLKWKLLREEQNGNISD